MDGSSVIFLVIIGMWAAYLVPHWLRRREQLSVSRSANRFSSAMRVLSRRTPTARPVRRQSVLATARVAPPSRGRSQVSVPAPSAGRRLAGRRRSVRRARAFALLLLATAASWTEVIVGQAPWWAAGAVTGLLVLDVFYLRLRLRREQARAGRRADGGRPAPRRGEDRARRSPVASRPMPTRSERLIAAAARARQASTGELLPASGGDTAAQGAWPTAVAVADPDAWQPIPVPPPTYTLKPRAPRYAVSTPAPTQPPAIEQEPEQEPTLDADLEAVLTRRLVVGE